MAKASWLPPRACLWTVNAVLFSVLLLSQGPVALAQQPGAGTEQAQAVEFYRRGREHFEAGRYRDAISDLEQAVTLDPSSPTLVYNVARVYELLGELDHSIRYYQVYLRMLSAEEEDERTRVAETIARLTGARDEMATNPDVVTSPDDAHLDRPVIVEERGVADTAFWATAVTAAVLLVGGGVMGGLALLMDSKADCVVGDQCTLVDRDGYATSADGLALAADILFITGGVAAVAATLLYALRTRQVETYPQYEGVTAFVGTDGHGAFVGVGGSF